MLDRATANQPLAGLRILVCAVNLPGPATGARLHQLGADVCKVEPPAGDPFEFLSPAWYRELSEGIDVRRLDLKAPASWAALNDLLHAADVLVTSSRVASLRRMSLDHDTLRTRFPSLCHVAIVGHEGELGDLAGHDLTYQARAGLLHNGLMPQSLIADLAGVEQAVNAVLRLLLLRERSVNCAERPVLYAEVSLSAAVQEFAKPFHYGITATTGLLGGADPFYQLYETSSGTIAIAALEPQFRTRLIEALELDVPDDKSAGIDVAEQLRAMFRTRSAAEWQRWAREKDLPIAEVRRN